MVLSQLNMKMRAAAWALLGAGRRRFLGACLISASLLMPQLVWAEAEATGWFERLGLPSVAANPLQLDQLGRGLELEAHQRLLDRIAAVGDPASAFVSDGCSGGLSATWQQVAGYWPGFAARYQDRPPFEPCCVTHDRAYHAITGAQSAAQSYEARLQADRQLRHCVQQVGAQDAQDLSRRYGVSPEGLQQAFRRLATTMYYAVRFGGGPCSGQPWRWGFGYSVC